MTNRGPNASETSSVSGRVYRLAGLAETSRERPTCRSRIRPELDRRVASRCTVGVALPLALALSAGRPLAGVSAAIGALSVGFASRQGVYRTRAAAMLLTASAMALSAFAGSTTAELPALNFPTISHLSDPAWVALNTILDEAVVRDVIPKLKAAGATGIVEYPLSKVVL